MIDKHHEQVVMCEASDPINHQLFRKFTTAIIYVQRTCVFGSTNIVRHLEDTGNWAGFMDLRYNGHGQYRKMKTPHTMDLDFHNFRSEFTNKFFISGSFCTVTKWEHIYVQPTLPDPNDPLEHGFFLIQSSPGKIPDYLYYYDKKNPWPARYLAVRPQKDMADFLKELFPYVINHQYPLATKLASKHLDLIAQYTFYTNQQWYFQPINFMANEYRLVVKQCFPDTGQMYSPASAVYHIIGHTMLVRDSRMGNCGQRCFLLTQYLWEHNEGIDSIEIASMNTFDHALVIVNREPGSDIHEPSTWGKDCFILESWYRGIFFRASEFQKMIPFIKQFALEQNKLLSSIYSITTHDIKLHAKETINEVLLAIYPQKEPYPAHLFTPRYPVGYCFNVLNIFSNDISGHKHFPENIDADFRRHLDKYIHCMQDLKTTASRKHGFFHHKVEHEKKDDPLLVIPTSHFGQ